MIGRHCNPGKSTNTTNGSDHSVSSHNCFLVTKLCEINPSNSLCMLYNWTETILAIFAVSDTENSAYLILCLCFMVCLFVVVVVVVFCSKIPSQQNWLGPGAKWSSQN